MRRSSGVNSLGESNPFSYALNTPVGRLFRVLSAMGRRNSDNPTMKVLSAQLSASRRPRRRDTAAMDVMNTTRRTPNPIASRLSLRFCRACLPRAAASPRKTSFPLPSPTPSVAPGAVLPMSPESISQPLPAEGAEVRLGRHRPAARGARLRRTRGTLGRRRRRRRRAVRGLRVRVGVVARGVLGRGLRVRHLAVSGVPAVRVGAVVAHRIGRGVVPGDLLRGYGLLRLEDRAGVPREEQPREEEEGRERDGDRAPLQREPCDGEGDQREDGDDEDDHAGDEHPAREREREDVDRVHGPRVRPRPGGLRRGRGRRCGGGDGRGAHPSRGREGSAILSLGSFFRRRRRSRSTTAPRTNAMRSPITRTTGNGGGGGGARTTREASAGTGTLPAWSAAVTRSEYVPATVTVIVALYSFPAPRPMGNEVHVAPSEEYSRTTGPGWRSITVAVMVRVPGSASRSSMETTGAVPSTRNSRSRGAVFPARSVAVSTTGTEPSLQETVPSNTAEANGGPEVPSTVNPAVPGFSSTAVSSTSVPGRISPPGGVIVSAGGVSSITMR